MGESRRGFRLDADQFDFSRIPRSDAPDETAAANGDEQSVQLRALLLEFEADASLTEQGFKLIVGVNAHGAGLRRPSFAGSEGVGIALADDHEVRATMADALDLLRGGDAGDEDLRGYAKLAAAIGDGHSEVAARRRRDSSFGDFAQEQICEGAWRLAT